MQLPSPLIQARLLRRYKRFFADIRLQGGVESTAHIANPGSMLGLTPDNAEIWVSQSTNPKRKLPLSWELLRLQSGAWVGVSTMHPNNIVAEALHEQKLEPFAGYQQIRREVNYAKQSRVDFLLSSPGKPDCFVEVKNVTMSRTPGLAEFPDSVTQRGAKHLHALAAQVQQGARAAMLYVIQRDDCDKLQFARDIDPHYAESFQAAREMGVEAYAFRCHINVNCARDASAFICLGCAASIVDCEI
jgi:sugar fermentation stimulation protein A